MGWLSLILLVPAFGIEMLCNPNWCPPIAVSLSQRGDGKCNPNCMTPYCNYDSGSIYNISSIVDFSDCIPECLPRGYEFDQVGDGECDLTPNTLSCGYDLGDCGYCAPSCISYLGEKSQLGNECDPECNTTLCYYDNGACLECSTGCILTIWGDGVCNEECNNSQCNYDNGDCFNLTCAPDCYLWMIGNSICDEACYIEECNFDSTDCDCFPGCTSELLQNDVCDEVCNNLNCNFDAGNCGYCESGCFVEMLRNDICEEACNTFRCKYDNYACGCSEYCKAEDYGKCKSSCLVSNCKYDRISNDPSKWCYDEDLMKYTVYQQFYQENTNNIVSFDGCSVASSYKCNISMSLDKESCYQECYFRECNYGLCRDKHGFFFPIPTSGTFNLCNDGNFFAYDNYCLTINLGWLVVICKNEYKSANLPDFQFYYVTSTQKGAYPSGNGSLISPFETIDYALKSISKKTLAQDLLSLYIKKDTFFIYLYNDGNYSLTNCSAFSETASFFTIASNDETKILIKINGWSKFSCYIPSSAKFENVIFDGSEQYSSCNDSIYCQYCAYSFFNQSDRYYYNDRNQRIAKSIPINNCKINNSKTLNLFSVNAALTLKNVEIRNFRFNYDSIISGNGTIQLYNVVFDNIWLSGKETNAVIHAYGESLDFKYIGGSVSRLNNGYEFGDPFDFRGFLYSESYSTFLIKNVYFKYNLVYLKPQSSLSSASLIYINKDMDHIEISNCTFMYNYCETGIFYSKLNVESYNLSINETLYLTYLTHSHIYIHDIFFISNYGKFGLIHIEFLDLLLNVHLQNFTIESNGAESDSLIYIYNSAILDFYKTTTTQRVVYKNSKSIAAISIPRWCKLIEISFKNNHALGMINAINLVNFDLKNLDIISNGSPSESATINSLILDYYIENKDLYISEAKSEVKATDCDFMVSLSNSIIKEIGSFNISKNVCRNASPTVMILNSNSFALASVSCSENIGNRQLPVCFYFTGPYDRNLTDSVFFRNINNYSSGYGALQIEGEGHLYIANCSFINNSASWSPAVYFSGVSIYIESSLFDSNEARQGNGGALYLLLLFKANKESSFIVSSCDFKNNKANSDGGAIILLQKSISSETINAIISQTNFTENYAMNGQHFI